MSFLQRLGKEQRARFEVLGSELTLTAGSYLLRRGDAAGDLYLLESGVLEVLDTAMGAATILAVLEPGAVVGEVSFLDDAPRTADVRARETCNIRRWGREDVHLLVDRDPSLAARLYEEMARTLAQRVRMLTDVAAPRGDARGPRGLADVDQDLLVEAHQLVDRAKEGLQVADDALRAHPFDPGASRQVRLALDRLDQDLRALFASRPSAEQSAEVARLLRRELRPWLGRSALAERCLRERSEVVVTVDVLAHVLADVARGEGPTGTQIDRWLLDRPSLVGRRLAEEAHLRRVAEVAEEGCRALFVDALVPSRMQALAARLGPRSGSLVLVDPSGEAMGVAEALLAAHATPVGVQRVQEGVVRLALGRVDADVGACDLVLLFGLLNYLPDRIATSVLRWARTPLRREGRMLVTSIDEGADEALLAHVLGWPTVRRTPARFERLAAGAGLRLARSTEVAGPVSLMELEPTGT